MSWRLVRARPRPPRRAVVLWAVGMLVAAGTLTWLAYGSSAFAVDRIEVRGVSFVDPEEVRRQSGVNLGEAMAAVDVDAAAERVAELTGVRRVEVSRSWSGALVIEVTERSPRLAVPIEAGFRLVDEFGVPYRTVDEIPEGVVETRLEDPGRRDPATAAALTVIAALTPELEAELVAVTASGPASVGLELSDDREIFWGDASRSDRKAEVATALLSRSEQHIDVSAPEVPTVS